MRTTVKPRDLQPGDKVDRLNVDLVIVQATVTKVVPRKINGVTKSYKVYLDRSDVPENRWPWAEYRHLGPFTVRPTQSVTVERPVPTGENVCSYCGQDRGEDGIFAVTQCQHFIDSSQCTECPTDQVCTECDSKSKGTISNRILGLG